MYFNPGAAHEERNYIFIVTTFCVKSNYFIEKGLKTEGSLTFEWRTKVIILQFLCEKQFCTLFCLYVMCMCCKLRVMSITDAMLLMTTPYSAIFSIKW